MLDRRAFRRLSLFIKFAKISKNEGLKLLQLDNLSSRIAVFTNASFGNTLENSLRSGFVIGKVDKKIHGNTLRYGSRNCRRVVEKWEGG